MPDISKCNGELPNGLCPLRDQCYRYTSPESISQSYADFGSRAYRDELGVFHCEDFQNNQIAEEKEG